MSGDRQAREIPCPETTSFSSVAGSSKSNLDDWCSRKVVPGYKHLPTGGGTLKEVAEHYLGRDPPKMTRDWLVLDATFQK